MQIAIDVIYSWLVINKVQAITLFVLFRGPYYQSIAYKFLFIYTKKK